MHRCSFLLALIVLALSTNGDPALPGWTFTATGPLAQPEISSAFVIAEPAFGSDEAVLFGGTESSGLEHTWTRAIRRYSFTTGTWQIASALMPYPYVANERFGAARASNGKYYVGPGNGWGGWGQHQRIIEVDLAAGSAIERAQIVTFSNIWGVAIAPAPASRGGVYLFGGWNGGGLSQILHYDPSTDAMTLKGFLQAGRTVGARVVHPNGNIYLFGGNTSGATHFMDVFDTSTETSRAIANPSQFRFYHGTHGFVGSDGSIYLWNPIDEGLGSSSGKIIRFDPNTETFEILGDPPGEGVHPGSLVDDPTSNAFYSFTHIAAGYVAGVSGTYVSEVRRLAPEAPADTTPPTIVSVTPSTREIWPPNHKMVSVTIAVVATDAVDASVTSRIVAVTSDEPDNGTGDGDTANDIVETGALSVQLRAERAGNGDGRVYTIEIESVDAAGNASRATTTVKVPRSR